MSLPYENSSSGDKALGEIQKILRGFGCTQFGTMVDEEKKSLMVQFKYRGRLCQVEASSAGYAQAWLKEHPYTNRTRATRQQHERKAVEIAEVAIYSILRDWIKGQITAVECGILSFEGAFLGQILLPSGRTLLDHVQHENLLPAPAEETA